MNTRMTGIRGKPLSCILFYKCPGLESPTRKIVVISYQFGPVGACFSPEITLNIKAVRPYYGTGRTGEA
jgi:hypothetical protein